MDDDTPPATTPAEVVAQRLNHLFATIRQDNGRKHTDEQLAAHVTETTGQRCSRQWVAELRKAQNRAPDLDRLQAIAGFFGVAPGYLFDQDQARAVDDDIATAQALKQLQANGIHLRQLQDLQPNQLRIVATLIKSLAEQNPGNEPD